MNVSAINLPKLDLGFRLFLTFVACANCSGDIDMPIPALAKCLNVSRQTIGKHLKSLVEGNVLKYKYSGKGMLNPNFYFKGSMSEKEFSEEKYNKFKSDF